MFHEKPKRKAPPPPRPPPPNIADYNSKSSFNLAQSQTSLQSNSPVEWNTFSSRREPSQPYSPLRGSMSSIQSNSSSSSMESGRSSSANSCEKMHNLQLSTVITVSINPDHNTQSTTTATFSKPRIIRPQSKKAAEVEKETSRNSSPPMPTVPPPSLPPGDCSVITPYGIALYEFKTTQPGDLEFQEDDVIHLLRRVSDDWLYGRSLGREGIFPQDFIRIEVPIPGDTYNATVIYEFKSDKPGDLSLVPGQKVRVLKHISSDWLYGSSNGKTGQFPKCFIS